MNPLTVLEPGRVPPSVVLAVVALLIAVDTLPLVGLAVPGDAVVIGAVTLAGACAGPWVVPAVITGSVVGWSAGYLLGRRLGRRADAGRWWGRQLTVAGRLLAGRGDRVLALAPFLPVVNALAPVVAGTRGTGLRRGLAFAALGSAAWACLYALVGFGARTGLGGLGSPTLTGLLPLAVAVPVSVLAAAVARRALRAAPARVATP